MYICGYNSKYGSGQYIGAVKSAMFIKIQVLSYTYVKNQPYGQNSMTDLMISNVGNSVKRKQIKSFR